VTEDIFKNRYISPIRSDSIYRVEIWYTKYAENILLEVSNAFSNL
jgi:hypothetical protein